MNDYKRDIQDTWRWRAQIYFVINGIRICLSVSVYRFVFFFCLTLYAIGFIIFIISGTLWIDILFQMLFMVALSSAIMWYIGKPKGAIQMIRNFNRIGLINSAGETPLLIEKKYDNHQKTWSFEFRNFGIPLTTWNDKKERIESGLNLNIVDIVERGKKYIVVTATSGNTILPTYVPWSYQDLYDDDFVLNFGKSLVGDVTVDFAKVPHVLIGGSTGSGKSVLLKCLLMQSIEKGAEVYIADFKGGVDFPCIWHNKASIIIDRKTLIVKLDDIVAELHRRKKLFVEHDCANISEYNKAYHSDLRRIIFACDEVAQLLDRTGMSKDDKAEITKIEASIATIARLGRAFGIHLILATQRPDANILSGQIKNNIDYRVCGRADDVLSQIILDKTDAADTISKFSQGRFLTYDGTLFQAYYFNDKARWSK